MVADNDDLAIIGMGCRLPGDVDSPAALWRLLVDGRDAIADPPADRIGAQRPGGYLRDVAGFDADFFGVSRREADVLDPQHRLLLEVAWEALEHAGLPPQRLAGTSTGVYIGISYDDYVRGLAGQPQELAGATLTNGFCVAAGRISYLLGLHGPSIALDTACSSSLVALHLAAQALRAGECDVALAGGVNLMLWPTTTRSYERMGMLSPTGRCHAFDVHADGFVRSEGCGVVVVKRLADATRAGDRVVAVIRGSAVNQDGRSDGLTAPSADAQQAVYQQALAAAGVTAADVGLIEAHGTGTVVGDPTEFTSLNRVYGGGPRPCALSSVKSHLGHLEPAAGVTGLITAVLCLWHGQIPANLHFTGWNPAFDTDGTCLFVPTRLTPWPNPNQTRRAAVSSFGFSGTNAHVILEQGPAPATHRIPARLGQPDVVLVPAASQRALPEAARRLADWLDDAGADVPVRDLAHTLAMRRSPGRGRLAVVADSPQALVQGLRAYAVGLAHPGVVSGSVGVGVTRKPVWVFSGQGSQWAGMGADLLATEPAFAETLAELDPLIRAEAGLSVLDVIRNARPVTGCGHIQPVLFAVQVALAATWRAHGVQPAAVIGHSMGEVAAAVVAGALSTSDGVRVICRRSALLSRIAGAGAMASVGLDRDAVEADLRAVAGHVAVAVHAGPESTVVAGEPAEVQRLIDQWQQRGIAASAIAVDVASHSPQVDPLLDELANVLAELAPGTPHVPFYSTVLNTGTDTDDPAFDAAYWCANLRRPVRFAPAIAAAAADRHSVFIEISPHPVVTHAITASLRGLCADPVVLSTLRRDENGPSTLLTHLAAAHCAGVDVDWSTMYGTGHLVDAPTTTFDRRRHWTELADPDGPRNTPAERPAAALPGRHAEVPGEERRHVWLADAGTALQPWLAEHRVHGAAVLPGAGYCAVALVAGGEAWRVPLDQLELRDVRFLTLLRLAEHTELSTTVRELTTQHGDCEIFGRGEDGSWMRHAAATIHQLPGPAPAETQSVAELTRAHPADVGPAALYSTLVGRGIEHGPAFAGVTALHRASDGRSIWARITVAAHQDALRATTVALDLAAQVLVAAMIEEPGDGPILPVAARSVRILGNPASATYAHATIAATTANGFTGDVRLLDDTGRPVVVLDGLEVLRRHVRTDIDRWFLEPVWQPTPRPSRPAAAVGEWLVIGEGDGTAETLASLLRTAGAEAAAVELPLDGERLTVLCEQIERLCPPAPPRAVVLLSARPRNDVDPDPALDGLRRTRRILAAATTVATRYPQPPRLYTVTWGGQATATGMSAAPAQAVPRGVVRVLIHEHPDVRATLIDGDAAAPSDAALQAVADELLAGADDDEVALRAADRYVAHLAYTPLTESERDFQQQSPTRYGVDRFRLRAGRLGDLDRLELAAAPHRPPGRGEVEIRVRAAGLNFRDVLTVMGLLPGDGDQRYQIGFECSGVVTAVADDVRSVRVGDEVVAVQLQGGAFGSFVTVPAAFVAPRPPGLDPVEAAGVPIGFLTAWYGLRHVANVTAGERVLIHSATGGTGLAAVAVARLLGAEVLATAGSDAKRRYLRDIGIQHVMDSRSLHFAAQTRTSTGGEGVDVVLNSLSGPAIRAGLQTLRPFGRFIELGVRDIDADTPLGLAPLRHNITLSTVDLTELQRHRPEQFTGIFTEVIAEFAAGRLTPLPSQTFPLDRATDAFRLMAGARHLGKVVLTVPDDGGTHVVDDGAPVHPDGAYIVTGGLHGVGLATAGWLAAHRAGHIILNGRHDPDPDATRAIADLRAASARITVILGDIGAAGTAEHLVAAATTDGLPIRGLVHSAMVLADAAVTNVTDEQLAAVWRPKVTGAWRLHQALDGHAPDWFVVYSSMSSLLGNPGQATYAAANAWLDGFAAWRTARGLPTLAINWGPWGETGAATGYARRGYRTIPTDAGLQALDTLLACRRIRTGVIPGTPATWIGPAARTSSLFRRLLEPEPRPEPPAEEHGVLADLAAAPTGLARRIAIEAHLAEHILAVLHLDRTALDPQTPLRALGFDSLLSMELRGRIESNFGVKLANNFVWTHPTLAALATGLAQYLGLDLHTPSPHQESTAH
jgi:polyketide synthase 2/polyketide synthase 5